MGAGGISDVQLANTANAVLYSCFCLMGFFAGSVNVSSRSNQPFATKSYPHG